MSDTLKLGDKTEGQNSDLVWKIATRPPVINFIDLTKETLFEMLMEVSNG